MTTALLDELDLGRDLQTVRRSGAAFTEKALTDRFTQDLRAEVADVPFEMMPAVEGRARQQGEVYPIERGNFAAFPQIEQLSNELVTAVQAYAPLLAGCGEWRPNEVHVQRYRAGYLGITPHLDMKRYHYIVAIFTADGQAPFVLCQDRSGTPVKTWTAAVSSLILLRAPGLGGVEDGRPLHMVRGPTSGQRISVSYRMNTAI